MNQLHPDLGYLANQYDQIVDDWTNGRITPEDGQAALDNLTVTDAAGQLWRIDPQTAEWQRTGPAGMWVAADPAEYVEPTAEQVDDWSHPGAGAGSGMWEGNDAPITPPAGWGEEDRGGWAPPVTPPREPQAPMYPQGYDAYDGAEMPPPAGMTADGYAAGGFVGDEWEESESIFDKMRSLVDTKVGKILIGVVGLLLVLGVASKFLGGGGRSCPGLADNITLVDVTATNQKAVECVLAANMMAALEYDATTGVLIFAETRVMDVRDLARSVGLSYVALGGGHRLAPLPPDVDQLDPAAPETRQAAITAYAVGLMEGSVASTEPASVDAAVRAVARLAFAAGVTGDATSPYVFLTEAGILGEEVVPGSGAAVTRGQLAQWLSALYETGATVSDQVAATTTTTAVSTPSTTTPTTTPTTTTMATTPAPTPTTEQVAAVVALLTSADRATAAGGLVEPGSDAVVALRTAELAGFATAGLTIRPGAPAADDTGAVFAILEATDTATGAVVATARVEMVLTGDTWLVRSWPEFTPAG